MYKLTVAVLGIFAGVAWLRITRATPFVIEEAAAARPSPKAVQAAAPKRASITVPAQRPSPEKPREADPMPELPPDADWHQLPLLGTPTPSAQWAGWLCADLEGPTRRSLWLAEGTIDGSPQIHDGTCAEWANRGPDEPDRNIEYDDQA